LTICSWQRRSSSSGGDAWLDVLADHLENLGGETPGYAHLLDIFGRLDGDCHANL